MRIVLTAILAVVQFGMADVVGGARTYAQSEPLRLAIKNGETFELQAVYWVVNCRSGMIGLPQVEVLEGPSEVSLSIKEGMVVPRRQNCSKPVAGGTLFITAKDVKRAGEAKLTFRLIYKTKDGDRQTSRVYHVSLFP